VKKNQILKKYKKHILKTKIPDAADKTFTFFPPEADCVFYILFLIFGFLFYSA